MKVAIMQPYFLPYIGYWQLIAAVDRFVVYDNIKYTKKGWINRNRFLLNGADEMFSLPLQKGPDSAEIVERTLSDAFEPEQLLAQLQGAYRRAPCYDRTLPLLRQILLYPERNLFRYLHHSIVSVCEALEIHTNIQVSSSLSIDHGLKAQDKVLALCRAAGADVYINPIGGVELYSREAFLDKGLQLHFLRARPFEYAQFRNGFVPWLSIVDVLMFNPVETVRECIRSSYDLV